MEDLKARIKADALADADAFLRKARVQSLPPATLLRCARTLQAQVESESRHGTPDNCLRLALRLAGVTKRPSLQAQKAWASASSAEWSDAAALFNDAMNRAEDIMARLRAAANAADAAAPAPAPALLAKPLLPAPPSVPVVPPSALLAPPAPPAPTAPPLSPLLDAPALTAAPPAVAAACFAGAEVVALPAPPLAVDDDEPASSSPFSSSARAPRALLLPSALVSRFTALAAANTAAPPRGVETCGILAGRPCADGLRVTHLLVPQQSGGADSCEMLREDEVLEACLRDGLMVLGWVHTHPTQTSFLSSLDLHTHAAYQLMLPEAVALVLAPCDADAPVAVFRLTDGGLEIIQRCELRGFHPHETPVVLFETSALVRWVGGGGGGGDGAVTVVDLRGTSLEKK